LETANTNLTNEITALTDANTGHTNDINAKNLELTDLNSQLSSEQTTLG
jgi:hypothetical protein